MTGGNLTALLTASPESSSVVTVEIPEGERLGVLPWHTSHLGDSTKTRPVSSTSLALTQASTVVLNSCRWRRVDESSFIPRFIPKLGQAVQEGHGKDHRVSAHWRGWGLSEHHGKVRANSVPAYEGSQRVSNASISLGRKQYPARTRAADAHLWSGHGGRRHAADSHR